MGAHKQLFAPVPLRAMAMELSGLQIRVLVCVAAHDRMTLVTGKGQGCRASNERMHRMIGCSYGKLCASLSELVGNGLLQREKLGRHTIYRVIYTDADRCLFGNTSTERTCAQTVEAGAVTCDHDFPESPAKLPKTASQYIPLNGGIDSVETGEDNSSEEARLAARGRVKLEFAHNVGGQLSKLERSLKAGEGLDCLGIYDWLEQVSEIEDFSHRAARLMETVVAAMSESEYREWGKAHGWVDEHGKWQSPDLRDDKPDTLLTATIFASHGTSGEPSQHFEGRSHK